MLRFPTKSTLTPKLPLAPKPLQLPLAPKLQLPLVECFPRGAGDEDPKAYAGEVFSQGSRGPGTARQGEVAPCQSVKPEDEEQKRSGRRAEAKWKKSRSEVEEVRSRRS